MAEKKRQFGSLLQDVQKHERILGNCFPAACLWKVFPGALIKLVDIQRCTKR